MQAEILCIAIAYAEIEAGQPDGALITERSWSTMRRHAQIPQKIV